MTGQDQFEKNVKRWSKYNPEAAVCLGAMACKDVTLVNMDKGAPNLTLTVQGQTCCYHNAENPEAEARNWVKGQEFKDAQVCYIFGVGLGYIYDALKDWLRLSYSHSLVFIEPNLEVIHRLFETERGSEMLFDEQVFIFHLDPEMKIIDQISGYFFAQRYQVCCSPLYSQVLSQLFHSVKTRIDFSIHLKKMSCMEFESYGLGFLSNYFRNAFYLPKAYQGNSLYGDFTGVPAIICGAGPSLAKNRHLLKKLKDKAVIFAGGTAMNALNADGILPHFGVGIDPNKDQFTRIIMNIAYEIPFFYRSRWLYDALQIIHGDRLYITGSSGYDIGKWLEQRFGIEGKDIDEGCNVLNFSLSIAAALGCNPIIFVGVDLAYSDDQSYASGLINHPLHNFRQHFRTKEATEELIVKNDIYGKPVYTLWKWVTESLWFSTFAAQHPGLTLINATEGGLGFAGIQNLPLEVVADKLLTKEIPLNQYVHGEIQNGRMPADLTFDALRESMEVLDVSLLNCMNICAKIQVELSKQHQQLLEGKELSDISDSKELETLKEELSKEKGYTFLLRGLGSGFDNLNALKRAKLEWNRELQDPRTLRQKGIEYELQRYLYFSEAARVNGKVLHAIIADQTHKAKHIDAQMARRKPAPPPNPFQDGSVYLYENNRLKISDPEMQLSVEEEFTPGLGGRYLAIYPNGKIKQEGYYKNGQLHGPAAFYSSTGIVLAKGWYINGLQQGKSLFYYADGSLQSIQRYKDGHWEGKQEYYYPDGTQRSVLNYKNGLLDGDVFLYHPTGKFARELHFKGGKRNGVERIWNETGLLLIEAYFKEDQPSGTARHWYLNGNLAVECTYSDADGSCLMHRWDENGLPVAEEQLVTDDYFDQVAKQTTLLTKSLEKMFTQVNTFVPIFSQVIDPGKQEETMKSILPELEKLQEKMDHLKAVSKEMAFEFENPQEPLWKTPSNQRAIESKLDIISKEMSKDILLIQEAFSETVKALSKKQQEEGKKNSSTGK